MTNSEICKILTRLPQLSLHGFFTGDKEDKRQEIYLRHRELDACIGTYHLMNSIHSPCSLETPQATLAPAL